MKFLNKKGQGVFNGFFVVLAIFVTLAALIVYIAVYPLINSVIQIFLSSSTDPVLNILVRLVPLFFLFGIGMAFFFMIATQRA